MDFKPIWENIFFKMLQRNKSGPLEQEIHIAVMDCKQSEQAKPRIKGGSKKFRAMMFKVKSNSS